MHILLISDTFPKSLDSYSEIDLNLASEYIAQGHQVTVLASTDNPAEVVWNKELGSSKIQLYRIHTGPAKTAFANYRSIYNLRSVRTTKTVIKEVAPDVIHIHKVNRGLSYYSIRLAKRYCKTVCVTAHDVSSFENTKIETYPHAYLLEKNKRAQETTLVEKTWQRAKRLVPIKYSSVVKYCLNQADLVAAVSNNLQTILVENGVQNVTTIYNGIQDKFWSADSLHREDLLTTYQLQGKKVVLFVGMVHSLKSFYTLLESIELLQNDVQNIVLVVAGESRGEFADALRQRGITAHMLGRIDAQSLRSWYQVSDLVATFSILNPISMIALEARASGAAVLWGCLSGSAEISWRKDDVGYVDAVTDPQALAGAMAQILTKSHVHQALVTASFNRMKDAFTIQRQAREYLEKFTELLQEK